MPRWRSFPATGARPGRSPEWAPGGPALARPGMRGHARWSAGDVDVVVDFEDALGHPRGTDGRVVFGPGADVAGQCHGVPAGVHADVAVVGNQRGPVQRVLDVHGDVGCVSIVPDRYLVPDVADTGQPGDRRRGR